VNVADAKLRSKKLPSLLLTADIITEWVALKVKMPRTASTRSRSTCAR
jgi:hypothetical protein